MKLFLKITTLFLMLLIFEQPLFSQNYKPTWESLDSRPIPRWFQDAKFGIFIHWGVYSVPAWRPLSNQIYASYAEWYYARVIDDFKNGGDEFHRKNFGKNFEYRDFAPSFKAELFNPDFWADLFKRSGAKYVVLTSKHHDGFCLWPTKSPFKKNWNSMDIGPHRDLLGDLTTAVRKKGLKMGLYYSIIEWETNKTGRKETGYWLNSKTIKKYSIPANRYVDDHLIPQLKELVNNYQPSLIFSDAGEWDGNEDYWKTKEFLAWLYNEAPNKNEVVVNDRWCKGMPGKHGDYFSSEYKDAELGHDYPWEESRGIGGSYGFNRAENLNDYSTSEELIHELIDIVSRGGNLLLNVGPTADGRIPVIMQQRLIDIGEWLKINGEAIYSTRALESSKLVAEEFVQFTRKDETLYVICTKWPAKSLLIKGKMVNNVQHISLLGSDVKVLWEQNQDGLKIYSPLVSTLSVPCNYAYVFKVD